LARVTELSSVHPEGFEQAIQQGINRANKTLRNVQGCWIKDMNVLIDDGNIQGYKVNVDVTFVLEDGSLRGHLLDKSRKEDWGTDTRGLRQER
jgi:flavin-binding protein dodecin